MKNQNAVKYLDDALKADVEARLEDGQSFKEIEQTLGISYYLLRKHWPGRNWTHAQTIQHATTMRNYAHV